MHEAGVVVASGEPILLDAVSRLFGSGDAAAAAYSSSESAFRAARPGDVALVDCDLVTGRVASVAALADDAGASLIVFRGGGSVDELQSFILAGVRGYLLKDIGGAELLEAVTKVAAGVRVLPIALAAELAEQLAAAKPVRPALTAREHEVVRLAAQGHSTERIASALFMSPSTAKTHLQHVYAKLGVPNRSAAIAQLAVLGLLSNLS